MIKLARWLGVKLMAKRRTKTKEDYEAETGTSLTPYRDPALPSNFVSPDKVEVIPSRHEIIDPYAHAPGIEGAEQIAHFNATPITRAKALIGKATAATVALGLLTAAAMVMLSDFFFFLWLFLASLEWVVCFLALAVLDFRETPASVTHKKIDGYLALMAREQRARLKKLYGYEGD